MKITMLTSISGSRSDGQDWPQRGESIEVDDGEAGDLIAAGHARRTDDSTATAAPQARAGNGDEAAPSDEPEADTGADTGTAPSGKPKPAARRKSR